MESTPPTASPGSPSDDERGRRRPRGLRVAGQVLHPLRSLRRGLVGMLAHRTGPPRRRPRLHRIAPLGLRGRVVLLALLVVLLLFVLPMAFVTDVARSDAGGIGADAVLSSVNAPAVAERTGIPEDAVRAYFSAASVYGDRGVDWALLAGIGRRECDHGRSTLPGCPDRTVNRCGARGPMQFLGNTWRSGTDPVTSGRCPGSSHFTGDPVGPPICEEQAGDGCDATHSGYATDGDGDGIADPWRWLDATHSAARMLVANGVADDVRAALRSYNASSSYGAAVTRYADEYRDQVADLELGSSTGGGGTGSAECNPDGDTDPPGDTNITPTMRRTMEALVACFGRGRFGLGCWRPQGDGDHPRGQACDFMFANGNQPDATHLDQGWRMARWLEANAEEYDVKYVIWQDRIWSVARQREGWRDYERYDDVCPTPAARTGDGRDCHTLMHYDHVHVSVEA